jgi:toxin YoeB
MTRRRDAVRRHGADRPQRTLVVATRFLIDLQHWIGTEPRTALRVIRIVLEVARDPRHGIGKPEPLRHDRAGDWSRRIDLTHRLLYRFDDSAVEFIAARFHYE